MSGFLLECKDLSVGYEKTPAAEHISFTLNPGDYLCVLGENGSGKTTLMKTLLGLLLPIDGHLHVSPELRKGGIGYLPQAKQAQKDFPATVMEVVMSGVTTRPWYRPFFTKAEKEKALGNLRKIGAENLAKARFADLSGGQQQRVLLARALCSTQSALLVDEPVSGLDSKATEMMYQTLKDLNESAIAVMMITHDVSASLPYATHVLLIGEETFFGTKEEFFSSGLEASTKAHIGGHSHD